ncbi:B3 domain-containing protein REM14 [Bienertia sinuspersici]
MGSFSNKNPHFFQPLLPNFQSNFVRSKRAIEYNKAHPEAKVDFTPRGFPYCHTFVKQYCLKWGGMPLPMKFARENGLTEQRCNVTLLDQKGGEFQLPLKYQKNGTSVYIGKWRQFHFKHNLKTGDPVVFELIASGENPTLNFYSKLLKLLFFFYE